MLIFDASKNKKIQMAIESQGISDDKLRFTFTIDTGGVSYGFPCTFNEGRVEVDIPPLSEVIKDLKAGNYQARLDVTGDDKYYLKPFDEQVIIKIDPVIKKVDITEQDVSEEIKLAVSSLIEVNESDKVDNKDDKVDKEETKVDNKDTKTGISAFFDKK